MPRSFPLMQFPGKRCSVLCSATLSCTHCCRMPWYARQFYGILWEPQQFFVEITQGRGEEQGDSLMAALYALAAARSSGRPVSTPRRGSGLRFLDDTYVAARPERVLELYEALRAALWRHARIELNSGKMRI